MLKSPQETLLGVKFWRYEQWKRQRTVPAFKKIRFEVISSRSHKFRAIWRRRVGLNIGPAAEISNFEEVGNFYSNQGLRMDQKTFIGAWGWFWKPFGSLLFFFLFKKIDFGNFSIDYFYRNIITERISKGQKTTHVMFCGQFSVLLKIESRDVVTSILKKSPDSGGFSKETKNRPRNQKACRRLFYLQLAHVLWNSWNYCLIN